jgi:hypothetical protein
MQKREPTTYENQVSWLRTQAYRALSAILERHPGDEAFGRFIRQEIIEGGLKSC